MKKGISLAIHLPEDLRFWKMANKDSWLFVDNYCRVKKLFRRRYKVILSQISLLSFMNFVLY